MPLLSRKRGNKSVLSQKDSKSVDGTQSSESCPMDVMMITVEQTYERHFSLIIKMNRIINEKSSVS